MNNPFENKEENLLDTMSNSNTTSNNISDAKIEIVQKNSKGKRKITIIKNWRLNKEELITHRKTFAKKNGCKGTIKIDPDNESDYILSFSGTWGDQVVQYLTKDCNIPISKIEIPQR